MPGVIWSLFTNQLQVIGEEILLGEAAAKEQEEQKHIILDHYKHRLRDRPSAPGWDEVNNKQEILFNRGLELSKYKTSDPWTMGDLRKVLK